MWKVSYNSDKNCYFLFHDELINLPYIPFYLKSYFSDFKEAEIACKVLNGVY